MAVTIELLADHPEHVERLARWHCAEDGRADDDEWVDFWRRQLRRECGRERIPIAFVALDRDAPVGHVALVEHNMDSHRELSPWLAGTLVHPSHRGKGVGTELVRHAVDCAAELGVGSLYLYTERARPFYEGLGWSHLWDEDYEGEPVAVMTLACVGELDPVTPVAAAHEIVEALPEAFARLEVLEGAGHFALEGCPGSLLAAPRGVRNR